MRNCIFLTLFLSTIISVQAGQLPLTAPDANVSARLSKSYGQLPLSFERNQGQSDKAVKFMSRGQGYTLFLTPSEAVLALRKAGPKPGGKLEQINGAKPGSPIPEVKGIKSTSSPETLALHMRLVGANLEPTVEGLDELPGKVNYLKGKDQKQWCTGVSTYGKVRYQGVYPGIDLVYYGKQRQLEYDFIVQPGADPKRIRLDFSGADGARIDAAGDLLLNTKDGELRFQKPVVYQTIAGKRQNVDGSFVLHKSSLHQGESKRKGQHLGFQVASYDPTHPLVIDPVLEYSTYLGGGNEDSGVDIAVDGVGNAYVTGYTSSSDFPTVNALYLNFGWGNYDAFVFKLSGDGQSVIYSTFLGGSNEDYGYGIAVDGAGNAYVTGSTFSTDFPTVNAKYPNHRGSSDTFVFKLSGDGQSIGYSTYFGSGFIDGGASIAVDDLGNAYVTGYVTGSMRDWSDFPTVNALYPNFGGGDYDAFVFKLSGDGQSVGYSTYLGGRDSDIGSGIAVDSAGNAYVTGYTQSSDFPTVNAAFSSNGGTKDAYVFKLSADGQSVGYSTYFGGGNEDFGSGIAVDSAGNAYVAGYTRSSNFPTVNALYPNFGGGTYDAYALKLSNDGKSVVYSTFLGGSYDDIGHGIAVDGVGNAYITGETGSPDFPTVNALYTNLRGPLDAFVFKIGGDGQSIGYSTYIGGDWVDIGFGIAVGGAGNAYVTGTTSSSDLPSVNALYPNLRGSTDALVAKLSNAPPTLTLQSPNSGEIWNGGSLQTISWISQNIDSGMRLRLYLSTDNGLNWEKIGGEENGIGFKLLNIPKKRYASKQALIKICLKQTTPICDISDAAFTINRAPVAEAGTRQTAVAGTVVTLNGVASHDPDSGPSAIYFSWTQLRGPSIVLNGVDTVSPSFTPTEPGMYVFGLTVNDGSANSLLDKVKVEITAAVCNLCKIISQ